MIRWHRALLGLFSGALCSCASLQHQDRDRALASLPGQESCFWMNTLFDWTVLNPTTLLVDAPVPNHPYLVKLFAPIPDLSFHVSLVFQTKFGSPDRFCRDNGYVIAAGPIPDREPVIAVRALTADQAKRLLAAAGTPKPRRHAGSVVSSAPGSAPSSAPSPAPAAH